MRVVPINVALMLAITVFVTWTTTHVYLEGHNDFLSFYAGAKLAFTSQLYDPQAVSDIQARETGWSGAALRFIRLPHYAVALTPFGLLPYTPSYWLWQLTNLAAVVAAALYWPFRRDRFAQVASMWPPLYWGFVNGQDTGLMLLAVTLLLRFQTAPAYVACLTKFQFMWLLPIRLRRREWFRSSLIMGALLAVPLLWNPAWPSDYIHSVLANRTVISKEPFTLFRFLGWYGLPLAAAAALIALRKLPAEIALAAILTISVLVSPHGFLQDYTLALPLAAILWQRVRDSSPFSAALQR